MLMDIKIIMRVFIKKLYTKCLYIRGERPQLKVPIRVGRSRSGPIFGTPFGPSLGLGLGPVSVHLGHNPVRS